MFDEYFKPPPNVDHPVPEVPTLVPAALTSSPSSTTVDQDALLAVFLPVNRPPMLNKENYVPCSSRLLQYTKSRPNVKLIYNSIINGLESIESYNHRFLKLMNDSKRNKHFLEKIASNLKFLNNLQPEWSQHVTIVHQTKDLHTADYTQLYDFLKYNQKEVDDLRAERLVRTNDPLALMANSKNPFNYLVFHQDQPSSSTYMQQPLPNNNNYNPQPSLNQNYKQQPMLNLEDIKDPRTAINMTLILMAKAFKLNYSTPTNNNQRILSNPRSRQIAQPSMNIGQDRQMQMVGGNGIKHQAEEFDLMAAAADLDEIQEVNANCILMANL
nr:hypothetical protein [Tanacetum cinerariifolium]